MLLLIGSASFGQRYDLLSGNFEAIKGIAEYNVAFDYSELEIHDYESEEAYLDKKREQLKEHPEKGEAFVQNWYSDRTEKYEPRFIEYFNSRFENGEVKVNKKSKCPIYDGRQDHVALSGLRHEPERKAR